MSGILVPGREWRARPLLHQKTPVLNSISDIIYPRWKSASFLFAENTLGLGSDSGHFLSVWPGRGSVRWSQIRKIRILWCPSSFNFISSWYAWLWRRFRNDFQIRARSLIGLEPRPIKPSDLKNWFSATIWYHLFTTLTYIWPLVLAITADSG